MGHIEKNISDNKLIIIVFLICLLFTLFLLSPVLLTLLKTPANTVNMMVGHYFEDYYEYLSFVRQGQEGRIFLSNLFTTEDKSLLFSPWWPYSVLGFLSFLVHINIAPTFLYWFSCVVFIFTFFILSFIAIHYFLVKKSSKTAFYVLILIMTAASFFTVSSKGGLVIAPFDFWYSIGSPFARFNVGTPHHQLTHMVFLLGLILLASQVKEKPSLRLYIGFFLTSFLLLLLSPPQLTLFWLAYLASSLVFFLLKFCTFAVKTPPRCPKLGHSAEQFGPELTAEGLSRSLEGLLGRWRSYCSPFFLSFIFLLPIAYLFYRLSLASPTYLSARRWDIQNMYYPPISLFVLNTGPLLVLALLGLPFYFRKITLARLLLFFVCLFSFLLILLPLNIFSFDVLKLLGFHNLRFATPASYIFLGIAAVEFLQRIFKKKVYFPVIFIFIILFFLPSLFSSWQSMKKGPYSAGFLQFMPREIYLGLKMLESQKDRLAVLTSSSSHLGLVTPSISGRRVYLGRSIFTLNFEEKVATAAKFYSLQMSEEEAKRFLKEEGIGYVVFSDMDGGKDQLQLHYRFLEPLWQNSRLTIFAPKELKL